MNIENLSILELKQMLARVNHDLKMNKPTLSRTAKKLNKTAEIIKSDYIIANEYAAKYTGNKQVNPSDNDKLKADIAIQRDIMDYLNNGGMIITRKTRKSIKPLSIKSSIITL